MESAIYTALYFVGYLLTVVAVHAAWNRSAPSAGAPQGRALMVVLGTAGVYLVIASSWILLQGGDWSWVPYLGLCLLCLAYCYWSLICLSESGRRYRIAHLVHSGKARTVKEILGVYDRDAIVRERLARLVQWNELYMQDGRYYSRNGRMYRASSIVYAWARLLGFDWLGRAE